MSTETLGKPMVLTPPDTEIMNAASQNILAQVNTLKLDFLPAMKEKMLSLQNALTRADNAYREALADITVQLNNVNLQPIDLRQQHIEADARLSDKQKKQAISLLNGERIRLLSNLTTVLRSSAHTIAERSDDMAQINLTLEDNRLQDILQQQIDGMTQRSAALESAMSVIAEDRRLLDTTIKTYEKYNLADLFKDMLPTQEELQIVTMPSPELALITAGIARLGKLLDKISSALTYLDLTEERDRLRSRYNALLAESRTVAQEAKSINGRLDELTGIADISKSKALWVKEARKVYQSLYNFLDQITSQDDASAPISTPVEKLKTYIRSFYDIRRLV